MVYFIFIFRNLIKKHYLDSNHSFFCIKLQVFSKLAAEEIEFLEDPEDVTKIPKFGNSTTPYEDVHEFYAYWMAFSTNKSKRFSDLPLRFYLN